MLEGFEPRSEYQVIPRRSRKDHPRLLELGNTVKLLGLQKG